MRPQQFAGTLRVRAVPPGAGGSAHDRPERVQVRHDKVVGFRPGGVRAMEPDHHVQDRHPVAAAGKFTVQADLGADGIGMDGERVPVGQPRQYLPVRRGHGSDNKLEARVSAQRKRRTKSTAEPAERCIGGVIGRAQPGGEVVNGEEQARAPGVRSQPMMTAKSDGLILERGGNEPPAAGQGFSERLLG